MLLHNRDASGDWLPVTTPADVLRGSEAVDRLVEDRLTLFQNEWWENPAIGNPALVLFRTLRPTESTLTQLTNAISAYITETPGILSVEDIQVSVENRRIHFSCRVTTAEGAVSVSTIF